MRALAALVLIALAASISGCATTSGAGSGVSEGSCQSMRAQLNKLDQKGVRSSVEAQAAGRKISPGQKADADAYNKLLNDYLGARCHEAKA